MVVRVTKRVDLAVLNGQLRKRILSKQRKYRSTMTEFNKASTAEENSQNTKSIYDFVYAFSRFLFKHQRSNFDFKNLAKIFPTQANQVNHHPV